MALQTHRVPDLAQSSPARWAAHYDCVYIDLGTGNGAHALHVARSQPGTAVIGLDTNIDHLTGSRKRRPGNVRFIQHDARTFPIGELPVANQITINFPYGSLLRGLIDGDPNLLARLDRLLGPDGRLTVRVNARAFVAGGFDPVRGVDDVVAGLRRIPSVSVAWSALSQDDVRRFPSEWAGRIGYGKPTRADLIEVCR